VGGVLLTGIAPFLFFYLFPVCYNVLGVIYLRVGKYVRVAPDKLFYDCSSYVFYGKAIPFFGYLSVKNHLQENIS
jgi:hypothetical protein